MLKKNKKIVYLSIFVALLLVIIFTQGIYAQVEKKFKGQTLIVAMPGGAWAEVTEKYIIGPFEEETGADIIVSTYGTSADAFSKLIIGKETEDFFYDVIVLGGGWQDRALAAGGLLQPMDYTKITNLSSLYPAAQPTYKIAPHKGYGPAIDFASIPLAYRTDKIKMNITSWYDLFDPQFKGKVGFIDPRNLGGVTLLWTFQLSEGGNLYDSSLSKAFKLLEEKLIPQDPVIWTSSSQSQILLSQGEMWISQMWDGRAFDLKTKGLPIEVIIPKEGAWTTKTTIDIVEECENIELAHAYINHRLSPISQAFFTTNLFYGFTNPLAEQFVPKEVLDVIFSGKEMENLRAIDYVYLQKYQDEWTQKFLQLE